MKKIEQLRALENGKGVQYLLDSAFRIFNNPMYMVDSYYHLIAATEGPKDVYAWNELMETGTFSLELREIFAREGIFESIANSKKLIHLEKKENWEGAYLNGHIVNRENIWVAGITMHDSFSPFDEETMGAFEVLIDKISLEIRDYEFFIKHPVGFFEDTVNKLLDDTAENTLVQHSQAQIIRHEFDNYLYIAVVDSPRHKMLDRVHQGRLAYFSSLIKTKFPSFRYAIYQGKIIILMGSQLKKYSEEPLLGLDESLFKMNNLSVGISGSFQSIYDFAAYYRQALRALEEGQNRQGGQSIFVHEES